MVASSRRKFLLGSNVMKTLISAIARVSRTRALLGLLAAIFFTGCGTTAVMTYPEPRREPSEVSMLSGQVRVKILKIDGKTVDGKAFELLPGEHRVRVKITFRGEDIAVAFKGMRRSCKANAKFVAEPGIEYRIVQVSKSGKTRANLTTLSFAHSFGIELRDETNDEVIPDAMSPMSC